MKKLKLSLSYETRKLILARVQVVGLTGLGWILRGLTCVLFGREKWRGFTSLSTSCWIRESVRYSLPETTIAGIDRALRENLSPEEAVDRLARKAGVSKKELKASKIQPWVESRERILTDDDLLAEKKALEASIANSIKIP